MQYYFGGLTEQKRGVIRVPEKIDDALIWKLIELKINNPTKYKQYLEVFKDVTKELFLLLKEIAEEEN